MEPFTIAVAVVATIAVLVLRPGRAAGVIVMSMLLWPEYLRVPMGVAQMSAPRIAAFFLAVRMIAGYPLPRWRWADVVVSAWWVWMILANVFAGAGENKLTNVAGMMFDTVLMYAVGRLTLRSLSDLRDMIAPLAICCGVMALSGVVENVTSTSPYYRLMAYHEWTWRGYKPEYRLGLMRAYGSTAQPIYFGMAMGMITGQLFSLRPLVKRKYLWAFAVGCGAIATCSSLSAGPMIMLACLVLCNALFWTPRLIGPALFAVVLAAAALEMLSNRHFYQLIDYLALDSGNAWYRSRLIEVAISHLDEYWAVGYGDKDFSHWGYDINAMGWVDVVNNYVMHAVQGGIAALVLYVTLKVLVMREAVAGYRKGSPLVRPIAYAQGAALLALSAAEMSVGLFGPALLMSFLFAGGMIGGWQTVGMTSARARVTRPAAVPRVRAREQVAS
jgi:hypothetical protein